MTESLAARRVLICLGLLTAAACSSAAGTRSDGATENDAGKSGSALPEHPVLTITGIAWKAGDDDPARLMENRGANILLCRVAEHFPNDGPDQYTRFTEAADREFKLRTADGKRFHATCRVGFEVSDELRAVWIAVPLDVAQTIPAGVPLELVPRNQSKRKWAVRSTVPPRPGPDEAPAPLKPEPIDTARDHASLTITRATWSDFPDSEDIVELHVAEWFDDQDGDQYTRFTDACDRTFTLRADGAPAVAAACGIGSITGPGRHSCALRVKRDAMLPGVPYRIVPRNEDPQRKWIVRDGVAITR